MLAGIVEAIIAAAAWQAIGRPWTPEPTKIAACLVCQHAWSRRSPLVPPGLS